MSAGRTAGDPALALLERVLAPAPPPFALLYRPETGAPGRVDVLTGPVGTVDRIAELPVPDSAHGPAGADLLALVPYRQLAERGFPAPDDGRPLLAMTVREQAVLDRSEVLDRIPDVPARLANEGFDIDDAAYARLVRRVLAEEIGAGAGANFVLKRRFVADITGYTAATAASLFRRLLSRETGVHWTFLIHTGDRTLVGASPERHVSLAGGTAVMNPISGTYRYPADGPTLGGVMDFLADHKETYELFMVVDEELKMMSRFCDGGIRVLGPFLKEMARLAHTEYVIEGRTDRDVREILRSTLFAPTVTGSPLESASRVISRYEPEGRGYYSGVAALVGRDGSGGRTLDSAILIRTADIDARGRMAVGVGATLVRDSHPDAEVAESRAKATALLDALRSEPDGPLGRHPSVRSALRARNADVARFWLDGPAPGEREYPALAGRRVLVVDAEDTFTAMMAHQLRTCGLDVTVRRFDEPYAFAEHDLVVMGPGPGSPLDIGEDRIAHLHAAVDALLETRRPFLAVCLSHQVLCHRLGLPVRRRGVPHQGVQKDVELFGRRERVGFYNSFAAYCADACPVTEGAGPVEVARNAATGEVNALRGPHFAGVQFHPESLLTRDGVRILGTLLAGALGGAGRPVRT
ncbi:anthranilate synthase family protein [Streptomyces sp. BRB040]|uniref:anthranilate synthase family protein n=1 Tax=Streptomyces sp. BRB040 TaxID=3142634 RepID=UPI0031F60051